MKSLQHVMVALLAGAWLAVSAPFAFADVSAQGGPIDTTTSPIKTVTVSSDTASAGTFQANSYILGVKIIATAANAVCGLFDSATLAGDSTTTMIDELREATSGETGVQMWPNPYKLTTDLSVGATNAICIVYYY